MAAALAENLNEKIGAAVDHGRMVAELWHRVDHSKDFPDADHPVEVAKCVAHDRNHDHPRDARSTIGLVERYLSSHFPKRVGAIRLQGALSAKEEEIAQSDIGHIGANRRGHFWQYDTQLA